MVLNELDWWLASQWEEFPTKHQYAVYKHKNGSEGRGAKFLSLRRYSKLKEVSCVRYADDFKIFTSSYQNAVKLFHATQNWLKDRLGLDISPEKSKVINLKEQYSEFLGFKLKVIPRGKYESGKTKYVVESHVKEKALTKIRSNLARLIHDIEFPKQGKHTEYDAISKYNSAVMGIHGYYNLATMVAADFRNIAFSVQKSLKARLKKRIKTAKEVKKKKIPCRTPPIIQERYGESKQMRYVGKHALAPIGYVQFKKPMHRKRIVNSYTPEGRAEIHKQLEKVDMFVLHYLMRNPIHSRSIEYNDNRLSLYSAQKGKCALTGRKMEIGDVYCHHRKPRHLGGNDKYQNLVLVCIEAHRLIHATNPDTIKKYMDLLELTPKQSKILKKFKESCLC